MKKFLVLVACAALTAAWFSTPAQALTIKGEGFQMHLSDATSLFTAAGQPRRPSYFGQPGQPAINPTDGFAPDTVAIGDESRSVATIDEIVYPASGTSTTLGPDVLSAISYGLTVAPTSTVVGTTTFLNFTGGTIDFYLDPTPTLTEPQVFNPLGDGKAPQSWTTPSVYTGVNDPTDDAVLWLHTEFVAQDLLGTTLTSVIFGNGTGASVGGYLKILGGTGAAQFQRDIYGIDQNGDGSFDAFADLSLSYTLYRYPRGEYMTVTPFAKDGGWQLESSDPIQGAGIPEPATLSLIGLGIAGLFGYRRRK